MTKIERPSKSKWIGILACLTLGLASQAAVAASAPKFEGTFQLQPKVMHTGTISGKIDLIYDAANLTQVALALDQPVFGLSNLVSSDQWARRRLSRIAWPALRTLGIL